MTFHQEPNRIDPAGPVGAYQTYAIAQQPDVLVRTACEQAGCLQWAHGWETHLDEGTPLGRQQAGWIRHRSGRTFTEHRTAEGLTVFRFASRQRCFADHRTTPQTFAVKAGDWRRFLGTIRRHQNGADWVEDFGEHQQTIADQQQKG